MGKLKPKETDGSAVIPIDHAFDIKGVGMWCLEWSRRERSGRTTSWHLRRAARRYLSSRYKTHDDPVDSSSSPSGVGLALKGATADDISRGDVICAPDAVRVSSGVISVKFAEPILQG
jgi:selenocysteine-specific translation elongation factor